MPVTEGQIEDWINRSSEDESLEFKEAKQQYDFQSLCEYCVALANEGGGVLLLGIADKTPREVVGSTAFLNLPELRKRLFEKLKFRVEAEEVQCRGKRVVVFQAPSRPRGTAYHLDGRYLMRSGGSLVGMTEDRLRAIFEEGRRDWLEEYCARTLTSQQAVDLLDTQAYFELIGQPYPARQEEVIQRLLDEKLIDRHGKGISVRRIGALLLAKRLGDFADVARKAPRVIVYAGTSKLDTIRDRVGAKGYATGFQGLVDFVSAQLPQNEIIEKALRKEAKLIPESVIRELIANALIHQDFTLSGASVAIEVFGDRVEISNPGEPLFPVERFIDSYRSRNERLAWLMRRFGICEEKGSGIDRVFHEVEFHQLPAPDFTSTPHRTTVTIFGFKPFEQMDRNDRVRATYQHCALKWVLRQRMTNSSLRSRFRLPESKSAIVSQVISAATEAGLIKLDERSGTSKKYAGYVPFWA